MSKHIHGHHPLTKNVFLCKNEHSFIKKSAVKALFKVHDGLLITISLNYLK